MNRALIVLGLVLRRKGMGSSMIDYAELVKRLLATVPAPSAECQ